MKLTVRNYHLDGYGHVNNARYLEFLEEARWTFFQEHDLLSELKDIMLVVARVDIRYRRPSLEGDVLTFTGRLKDIGTRHIILSQTATLPNGKAAISGKTSLNGIENGRYDLKLFGPQAEEIAGKAQIKVGDSTKEIGLAGKKE